MHWPLQILLILGLLSAAWLWASRRRRAGQSVVQNAAHNIAGQAQQLYSAPHEYASVRAADFPGLDHAAYDRLQADLEARGFRCLGDFQDVTVSRTFGRGNCLRRFVSADGATMAAFYQLVPHASNSQPLDANPSYLDLESEFADSSFLCTSNTANTKSSPVTGILNQRRPQPTPHDELLALHRTKLADLITHEARVVRPITDAEEYEAAQHRQQALKNRHRQEMGYVDLAQVKAIAAHRSLEETCAPLFDKLAAIQKQNTTTGGRVDR